MTASKIVLNAASGVGGAGLDVEEVFSTFLYTGNNTANRVINNGIDLAGEGGIVWTKIRYPAGDHSLWTTDIGAGYRLLPNETNAKLTDGGLTSFNNNGFTIQDNSSTNPNNNTMASWTFRKAPKFFDVVTWTGNGVAGREIPHNLGCAVGAMFIKRTDDSKYWPVYHRSTTATHFLRLNSTAAAQDSTIPFGDVEPTSTVFTVSGDEVVNTSGGTYVAYLFAHNDGDGEFGPDADADIIKCGSYTGNGSATGPSVNLGFEPQWLLIRNVDRADDWVLIDSMRGIPSSSNGPAVLRPDSNAAEDASGSSFSQASRVDLTATGFDVKSSNSRVNGSSQNMIYIAIRRGTKVPESGTEVFKTYDLTSASLNTLVSTSFPPDMSLHLSNDGNKLTVNRLTGGIHANSSNNSPRNWLQLYGNDAEDTGNYGLYYDFNSTSFKVSNNGYSGQSDSPYAYMWKRAPKYFDLVAYSGNSTAGRTVSHNLGVAPEMFWIKNRTHGAEDWIVYHKDIGNGKYLILHDIYGETTDTSNARLHGTNPTATNFTLGSNVQVNASGDDYIAHLFATLDGISKVGSYTGNGSNQTIDCGFSSGARWILIKRTDSTVSTGNYYVWDTERGIVAGNEQHTVMNTATGKGTDDSVDPASSGFIVNQISATDINVSSAEYIFYAIA
jgi:hypothetical protein